MDLSAAMHTDQRKWMTIPDMVEATGLTEAASRLAVVDLLARGKLERGFNWHCAIAELQSLEGAQL